jgi:hypothetical protein
MDGITYNIFLTPTKYPSDTGVKDGTKITLSD